MMDLLNLIKKEIIYEIFKDDEDDDQLPPELTLNI